MYVVYVVWQASYLNGRISQTRPLSEIDSNMMDKTVQFEYQQDALDAIKSLGYNNLLTLRDKNNPSYTDLVFAFNETGKNDGEVIGCFFGIEEVIE